MRVNNRYRFWKQRRKLGRRRSVLAYLWAPLSFRERMVYGSVFLVATIGLTTVVVRANISDVGTIMSVPATQCSAEAGWRNNELAQGQPSVAYDASATGITTENAAESTTNGSITCLGYKNTDDVRTATAVNISLRATEIATIDTTDEETPIETDEIIEESSDEETPVEEATPEIVFSTTSLDSQKMDGRAEPLQPNELGLDLASEITSPLLSVEVSGDQGATWTKIHTFDSSLFLSDSPHEAVLLPDGIADNLEQLAVRITSQGDTEYRQLLIDSITIVYEKGLDKEIEVKALDGRGEVIEEDTPILTADSEISFELSAKDPNDGIVQGVTSNITSVFDSDDDRPQLSVDSVIVDTNGTVVATQETDGDWKDVSLANTDKWDVNISMPRGSDPGRYTIQMDVITEDGAQERLTQDFIWGVLALNTDKTVYRPDETARIMMTVLDQFGATVCEANLSLKISGPGLNATLTTDSQQISRNETCETYGPQIAPDYEVPQQLNGPGEYQLELTAVTANGQFQIADSIFVEETPLFDVSREGPTRIFPVVDYPMSISVTASSAYSGIVSETVPKEFSIKSGQFGTEFSTVRTVGNSKVIDWNVSLDAGESITLGYTFDAPDIAPEFYLLGPLSFQAGDETVWQESRSWQIAGDALDIFRVTTYEIEGTTFSGTSYTLTLNNNLSTNYYTTISGGSSSTASRAINQDQVRVTGDPHSNFSSVTSTNQIELSRANSTNNWIGSVNVIECTASCSTDGFALSEVVEHSMAAGTANSQQTTYATLSSNHTSNTVPFGGRNGGGITSTSSSNNEYSATAGIKISKSGSNQIRYDRYGAESRVPGASTLTTYIVEWGSNWTVQSANVTGTNNGSGLNSTGHYNTASISSVTRANTFVWGSGFNRDDGLGDGALGQVFTLGDGVNQNTSETSVAVGGEGGMIAPGRDFEIFIMEHPTITVNHYFHARGDQGASSGYQELNETISGAGGAESYDNSSSSVRYTEGDRHALLSTTSGGTGQAYSRTGAWGTRITSDTNLLWWRSYAGQPVTSWIQILDFSGFTIGFPDTQQLHYRWRDDSTDLNTTGGWLAAEDTEATDVDKLSTTRLRVSVANEGDGTEDAARTYELQFANKSGFGSCSAITTWTGVGDSSDEVAMANTSNIDPDGELTTSALLANSEGYSFLSGDGRKTSDTTASIGPMIDSYHTELEYSIEFTEDAIAGDTFCFRLYDTANTETLDGYQVFPEITLATTKVVFSALGEAGTFESEDDGGWSTITYESTYTTPVVVGITNTRNEGPALVFEARNVTTTSAQMRVCDSQGSTANGCDTHGTETVGYMVIDAAVAATTSGIEAGTFTASGADDSSNVTTNYSESFSTTPLVFANVNTVNSSQFPIEVVINNTSTGSFNAGICDHLQGNADNCDNTHGNETVGWVAVEPGNEPFLSEFDNGSQSIDTDSDSWQAITFSTSFSSVPVMLGASQTDSGGQDVEIDEARNVTLSGADVHFCELDATNTCDSHSADTFAWMAIEKGPIEDALVLDQDGFRWYQGQNNVTPTNPLGSENEDILNVANNDVVRLRIAAQNSVYAQPSSKFDMKLQYAQASDCSAAGSWTDVGGIGSGTIWRGFNQGGATTDGSTLPSSLLDGGVNNLMTYEESNNSAQNPNSVPANERAEWDWVIQNNNAGSVTPYCFRMVSTDGGGTPIQYTRYAKLTTASTEPPQNPNSPASLDQKKTNDDSIAAGGYTNENSVKFTANVSDGNSSDVLSLCVEVRQTGTAFTNTELACGDTVIYNGSAVAAEVTISGGVSGQEYHWQARVRDALGAYSSWVSYGGNPETSRDLGVDTGDPTGTVYDGSTTGVDIDYNDGTLDELDANWNITDSISGISEYEYSIGTVPSATDIVSWTSNGTTSSVTASSLSLKTSSPYYFNIRTTDNAGNQSVISSDGLLVAPTLSFSSSPNTVTFDVLGAGNSYTSTKTTTLTTSTNAYNGYEIRGYATGLLTNTNSAATIGMFDGGTYASPDAWQGGDTGFGYTSNDTTIQGSNLFGSLPCLGGGNPPCYAPFSTTAPGDIVADHTNTISGTAVVNENFIVTHRVTTTGAQEFGTYQTTVIFTITARY